MSAIEKRDQRKRKARAVLGSAAGFVGFNAGVAAGVVVGLVKRDRSAGTRVGVPMACRNMLKLAGVRLRIVGEENMWRARPAIFISNHQSSLDIPVVGALLQRNFTGVAKRAARFDPRSMLAGVLLDPAFINRNDPAQSRREMAKLIERIHAGTSVMIWPEGTRMPAAEPGRFKKGALHLAIQAGVPIVPIVVRNTGELMASGAKVTYPGTVDVAVLDPVPTDGWTVDELDQRAAELRELYVRTLSSWPTEQA